MKHRRQRRIPRTAAALLLSGGMALSATAAWAAPTPDSGPVAGGTTVTVELPEASVEFVQVSAGFMYTMALDSAGNAYGWGNGDLGQLGDGQIPGGSNVPLPVVGGHTFTSISAGLSHTVALDSSGNAYAWGGNDFGQLGDGTYTASSVPVPVADGYTFTSIFAGFDYTVALDAAGNAYAWGNNDFGQLGDGTYTASSVPVPVAGGISFASISAGFQHTVALDSAGNAYAWGGNSQGQLGDGTNTVSTVPVPVAGGHTFTSISASAAPFTVALDSAGSAYAWGLNNSGQLGNGTYTDSNVPVPVAGGHTFASISAGSSHAAAIDSSGNAYGWGQNNQGQLGDGTNTGSTVPVSVAGGHTFASISAGASHTAAIDSSGNAYGWGTNGAGELGDGTWNDLSNVAVPAVMPSILLTGVSFGGVPADTANFVEVSPGVWTVVTPAHAAGPVEVVVEYTVGGVAQNPLVYEDGFSYLEAPALTDPAGVSAACNTDASFSTEVTAGYPEVTPAWEESTDGGTTWVPAQGAVSSDGLTLTVTVVEALNSTQYRAVASNSEGDAASAAATLTVTCEGGGSGTGGDNGASGGSGTGGDYERKSAATELAQTGALSSAVLAILGIITALIGAGLVGTHLLARRRHL